MITSKPSRVNYSRPRFPLYSANKDLHHPRTVYTFLSSSFKTACPLASWLGTILNTVRANVKSTVSLKTHTHTHINRAKSVFTKQNMFYFGCGTAHTHTRPVIMTLGLLEQWGNGCSIIGKRGETGSISMIDICVAITILLSSHNNCHAPPEGG